MKTVGLFLALILVVIVVGAIVQETDRCESRGGTLVRTSLGGLVCVKEAP